MFHIAPWDQGRLTVNEFLNACDQIDTVNKRIAEREAGGE